ncbi:NB-ARC domain-containing disease resistance protein [Zostera marina]|uniref:NB-ARC domain-containing disease resistance protein n=1 Tax=Zostera marina TaxID=29655 RepID=A0A0K9NZJ0_ZOSMR|nr:NB-ARC domain-containing disease resistance protein [Zostera marina]
MERNKKAVYKALEEQNVNVIGVFGMGGIGKTTLMQKINNEMEKRSDFKFVIMVTVSQNLDIKKYKIKLNVDYQRITLVISWMINVVLQEQIFFKDVWKKDRTVCKTMGAKEIIIDALGTDESWKLFESTNIGSNKEVDAKVKHAVCKDCAGLPLAISVVAKSLNNNQLGEDDWLKSLRYLKNVDPEGMGSRKRIVYKSVELSL